MNASCSLTSFTWKPTSWDVREVMMFVVVADIKGDHVEGAVVGVGLEALVEHVVLGNEVTGDRVQAHGHH